MASDLCKAVGTCHTYLKAGASKIDLASVTATVLGGAASTAARNKLASQLRHYIKKVAAFSGAHNPSFGASTKILAKPSAKGDFDLRILAMAENFPFEESSSAAALMGTGFSEVWVSFNEKYNEKLEKMTDDMEIEAFARRYAKKVRVCTPCAATPTARAPH